MAGDCLLWHQLRRARGRSLSDRLVPDRVDHRGLLTIFETDSFRLALPLPRGHSHDWRGAGGLEANIQTALPMVYRLLPSLLPSGDFHVGAPASCDPDALLLQLNHGLPIDHHLLPCIPHRAGGLSLHQDTPRQGAYDSARYLVDLVLHHTYCSRGDDAAPVLALHGLPRLQGQLYHVVVLLEGHVEGGARSPWLQEDCIQGDGEEGRWFAQKGSLGERIERSPL